MRRIAPLLALATGLFAATAALRAFAPAPATDVRALWVQRSSLVSPESVARMVATAKDAGFNTLFVQVRGRGESFYRSDLEPRATELDDQPPTFDPLAKTLEIAHAAGLKVHAWVNVNLVASGATLPRSRMHVASRHPEWLMLPKPLLATLGGVDPRSPAYVGTLSRWARANTATVEGLYLSPLVATSQEYTAEVIAELTTRYAIDGLQFDYLRFPNTDFDYSAAALAEFRASQVPLVSAADRQRLDAALANDLGAWAEFKPGAWTSFRRDRLTQLVVRLQAAARAARPGLVISAAVAPSATDARDLKFQDWRAWAAAKYLDVVCPMLYTTETENFAAAVAPAIEAAGETPVWAGIGAYRLPVARTAENVRAARRAGAAGIVVFSFESLAPAAKLSEYMLSLRPVLLETTSASVAGR